MKDWLGASVTKQTGRQVPLPPHFGALRDFQTANSGYLSRSGASPSWVSSRSGQEATRAVGLSECL